MGKCGRCVCDVCAICVRDTGAGGLCLHHVSRENLSDLRDIPEDIQAASVAIDDEGALCIVWSHGEHRSRFNPAWLYAHSGHQPISRLTAELWDTAKLPEPPTFCADKGIVSDSLLYDVLVSVARHGIARLRDLPTDLELVEDFALRIGAIRETHFDRIFDVISKADGDSNAYTTGYLAAHTAGSYTPLTLPTICRLQFSASVSAITQSPRDH